MQMKNKILASLTVLCAALVLVGGFSVTAHAQTPTEETNDRGVPLSCRALKLWRGSL